MGKKKGGCDGGLGKDPPSSSLERKGEVGGEWLWFRFKAVRRSPIFLTERLKKKAYLVGVKQSSQQSEGLAV